MKQVEYYKNGNRTLRIKYEGIKKLLEKQYKEIERLNNIINELEKYINEQIERSDYTRLDTFDDVYDYLQELKGVDKE